ncbi:MAG: hypothetical protein JXR25_05395 [Pontiellaceae bacterium]|nr:hypothetical protein [Pontiellaceae bacterium]MBN2784240.1 hypothetical protein [Pontiellaceae bacterium]
MEAKRQSGIGIASFIISTLSGFLMFVMIIIAGVMESSRLGGIDEESYAAVILGFSIIGFLILSLLSLGLGIGGLVQANRIRVFAILGVAISALTIVGTLSLMAVGLMIA